mgnify:CR=1 FL=1
MTARRPVAFDHTHEQATETYDGFMSKLDKIKLNASYTGSQIDALLAGKSDITHNHDSAYAPITHTHDDRYYTETEMNSLLSGKSDTTHNHDATYATLSHTHDDRYYTESETTTLLGGYLPLTGGTLTGPLQINSVNTGDTLLRFATDRPWKFWQKYDDGSTALILSPENDVKVFEIRSQDDTKGVSIRPYNTGSSIYIDGGIVWHAGNDGTGSTLDADLLDGQHASYFQSLLVSGTNIKTINGSSVLGAGDLVVSATVDWSQVFDDSGTYRGYKAKSGSSTGYMRTPSDGLLPNVSSASGSGYVGTPSWPFLNIYGINIYQDGNKVLAIAGQETTDPRTLKMSDGTIIKWGTITTAILACSTAVGGLYRMASDQTLTFDTSYPFTVEPTVVVVLKYASGYMWAVLRSASTTNFTYNILSSVSVTSGVPWQLRYFAIGR